jgi:glucose/arabinose dehydrogenase
MRRGGAATAWVLAVIMGGTLVACTDGDEDESVEVPTPSITSPSPTPTPTPPTPTPTPTATPTQRVVPQSVTVAGTVVGDLEAPWGLTFLPDGSALVAERDSGSVVAIRPDGGTSVVGTVPGVRASGEGGLLGLETSPNFRTDRLVYAYFTAADDNRVVRMTYDGTGFGDAQPILTGIPKGGIHNGGRLAFGPDGMLYIGTGEAGDRPLSQNLDSLGGKILRITPDGGVPPDNPIAGSLIWSYGHRNVQGLAFDSQGRLWASEFGQNTFDELNLVQRGGNHGWPVVEGPSNDPRFVAPAATWSTSDASPSGIAIVDDVVYMAALRGRRLWQIPIEGNGVGPLRAFFTGELGRLRTVEPAPDGSLWLATSNRDGRGNPRAGDDVILRLNLA